ncbi:GNAT family N-acetyltransferase [Devosia albogilva]|uniref:GNAT family N-acetyltransferase n=1 Tax=Devosia albogilva TaxID=429726 RepID=A0ABW5QEN2_9HYPH
MADNDQIWSLTRSMPLLEEHSPRSIRLQATHFAGTSAVAERGGEVLGWATGYVLPEQTDTLFLWQVCVSDDAQGDHLGSRLVVDVLSRPACDRVTTLQCTIRHDDEPSWDLFTSIARRLKAQMRQIEPFDRRQQSSGLTEYSVSIGPFDRRIILELAGSA